METSSSSSTPSSPSKMPAKASNDESQALQLRKATEVLANMSVSKRNPATSASQDSQLIKPGQRVLDNEGSQSQTPQEPMEQGLSKITLTEIDDQIQMVGKKVVANAILAEKKTKLTAMLSGARDIRVNYASHENYRDWHRDANIQLVPGCKLKSSRRSKTTPFFN